MRILTITWEYPPHIVGGLGRHVHNLSIHLASKGADVTVLSFTDGTSERHERADGVEIVRVNPYVMRYPDFVSWIEGLNMLMVERAADLGSFDLIHVHDWLTAYSGIALKHMWRRPLVATIHATELGRRKVLSNDSERHIHEMEWWLAYEAWKVICCSKYMMNEVHSSLGCPIDKISVIHNGYDPKLARANSAGMSKRKARTVLFVGRLVYEKGPHLLVEAASLLKDCRVIIVGDGAMRPYLEGLARKLGVSDRVTFTGHVDDETLLSIYEEASVLVIPSLYEPFGIVVLEAMSLGIPVIVSNTGGLDEIITDGRDGLKFQSGSPEELAKAIARILDDEGLRARLVENAKSRAKEFSWKTTADQTLKLYKKVLEEYNANDWKPKASARW
ncbi:MAG: glycosyl transferase group 1 [Candidatus Methanosuratincola subterraneus]|uniref:Glycosyl transferase group 1 n=1 Tax=Methanosuratincola subterraneus TaxID=2593994 RepID=A0A444L5L6_METS7|nr:MAG: glycosyl transferase group 1 [Candidatus Methanosuratincola subterraneus]